MIFQAGIIYKTTEDLLDGREIIKVHIASTPTQQKNLTSFEIVLNPNQ